VSTRKQQILAAAMALADEHGLASVTMRAVADRVGVTPMALYGHVNDKEGLLDAMLGTLLAELSPPAPDIPWPERLRQLAHGARQLAQGHPGAFGLIFSRPATTPDAVRVVDVIYVALIDAGVPLAEVPRVERLVSTMVLGFAVSEANGRFRGNASVPRRLRGRLPDGELAGHRALGQWLAQPVDWEAEFEADLDDLVRLIKSVGQT
jgi:AcrR family transcriptional regulator